MALCLDFCLFFLLGTKPFSFVQWAVVFDLGKKVSRRVTAEGVTSEAEDARCDCLQPLNFRIQFSPRTSLWTSLFFKVISLLSGVIIWGAISKNKDR